MARLGRAHFANRRRVILFALAPTLLTAALALYRPTLFTRLDSAVYDLLLRGAPINPPGDRVVIVDVDERSLASVGQWPWRRTLVADLLEHIRNSGAASIALDMIFAEPDRFDQELAGDLRAGASASRADFLGPSDGALATVLEGGRVVLGYGLTFDPGAASHCILHPVNLALIEPRPAAEPPFFAATGAVCSLPRLSTAAGSSGFLNAAPDVDGILRRAPVLLQLDDRIYPSLGLAAFLAGTRAGSVELRAEHANASVLVAGGRTVPLDGRSNLLLRYRGGARSFPYVSAADILNKRLPSDTLRDKIVFVGTTALGTRDVVSTPLDTLFAGVEIHATVADNLLEGDFVWRHRDARLIETLVVLSLGIAAALLVARAGLFWGTAGAVVSLTVIWAGAARLLGEAGAFWSPVLPTIGLTTAFASMTVARFTVERRRAEEAGQETSETQRLMVQALLSLTEVRDAETGRHSRRTQRYARLLANQLSRNPSFRAALPPERIELLASLAPLHDIGKVGIPDQLLNKRGDLTPEELVEMRRHPTYGRDVIVNAERRVGVHDVEILELAKEIVYTHHEKWDGSGYPQGLKGEAIPVPGRVMAIVDVYDAVLTRRLYRPPMSHEQAVAFISKGSGTHFDPAVVDAFLQVQAGFAELSSDPELTEG
jgi:CHASE2 domain-containing sensor protein